MTSLALHNKDSYSTMLRSIKAVNNPLFYDGNLHLLFTSLSQHSVFLPFYSNDHIRIMKPGKILIIQRRGGIFHRSQTLKSRQVFRRITAK